MTIWTEQETFELITIWNAHIIPNKYSLSVKYEAEDGMPGVWFYLFWLTRDCSLCSIYNKEQLRARIRILIKQNKIRSL